MTSDQIDNAYKIVGYAILAIIVFGVSITVNVFLAQDREYKHMVELKEVGDGSL